MDLSEGQGTAAIQFPVLKNFQLNHTNLSILM